MKASSVGVLTRAAALAATLIAARVVPAQSLTSRPASIALTVVVPPRAEPGRPADAGSDARIVRRTASAVDIETSVGVDDRLTSRVEIRLDATGMPDARRVWVRDHRGLFEPLVAGSTVVAFDVPVDRAVSRPSLRFRIENDSSCAQPPSGLPVEYRLRVGSEDRIAVWSFRALVRPYDVP